MSQVYLSPDALRDAQAQLRQLRGTTQREAERHSRLVYEAEAILSDLARAVLDELNPQHWFDPNPHWERSGLARIAHEAGDSHATMGHVNGETRVALERVCTVHGDFVGSRLSEHGQEMVQAVGGAVTFLWNVVNAFGPNNLLWYLREPWVPTGHFNDAKARLIESADQIERFVAYLERLIAAEAQAVYVLLNPPRVAVPSTADAPKAAPPSSRAASAPPSSVKGQQIADKAGQYVKLLGPGASWDVKGEIVYDRLDVSQIPPAELQQVMTALNAGGWNSHGAGQDIECVAFCCMVFAAEGISLPHTLFAYYGAGDAQNWMADFAGQPGWQEIQNGNGVPQPGDVIVMTGGDGGWGHVAIVTKVQGGTVYFAQGNSGAREGHFPINSTSGYTDAADRVSGWGSGWNVLGYIRHTGQQ